MKGSMKASPEVRYIHAYINRDPKDVYEFASNPKNLPKWAKGLSGSIVQENGEWIAESPMGKIKVRFVEKNNFGVLDHEVELESGIRVYNPMRVVAHGKGCEMSFTLFRQPDMSDSKFQEDAEFVQRDLNTLKNLLESQK